MNDNGEDRMSLSRRHFLHAAALGGLGLSVASTTPLLGTPTAKRVAALDILVLGGTGFIGPHLVRHARDRGHTLTLFNRGRTNTHLFPDVEKLVGDRNDDVEALRGRRWDAVIDNSGYTPDQVRLTAELLRDATDQYLFTSTRGVYRDFTADDMTEDAPIGPDLPESQWQGYGPMKVLAERVASAVFGERCTIARPSIIVGPGDRSDRFTYWVDRIDDGGEVLATGDPLDPVQYIDVRDLSEFYVRLVEARAPGVFNAEGPEASQSAAELLYGIRAVTSTPVSFTWVSWDFLAENDVLPSRDLPFWQPPRGRYRNYGRMNNRAAIAAGLRFRPLAVTASETLAWHRTRPAAQQEHLRIGISRDREVRLLEAWKRVEGPP